MLVRDQNKRRAKNVAFWVVICGLAAMLAYLVSTNEGSWRWKVFDVAFPIWGAIVIISLRLAWLRRRERSPVGK
jgi:hypothetical protein